MSGIPTDPSRHGIGGVSLAEIRAFRTSISARRFPALREMRDEDIAALVIANKKINQKRLLGTKAGLAEVHPGKSKPLDDFQRFHVGSSMAEPPPMNASKSRETRPAFSPCNPSQAKEDIYRQGAEPFVGCTEPFERHYTREDMAKETKPFVPNAPSQAKKTISIDYFLNSPDEETLAEEKGFIYARAENNTTKLKNTGYGRVVKTQEAYKTTQAGIELEV
eukprot:CAMPEP_0196587780 /NCGR_PEP_ID=MMETSP1081-20130531/58570_1 /TAXON_ID=36882 /ORGANISM="Pyramimonas amylifera, Strain CCMP720" /LENGTH=220 /DNA_ID=CAMNT_0041910061 /DNA_START=126 /DNA_END=788 /DNA_ORIENTATION=+